MNIGFIGAGKVGTALGKYFSGAAGVSGYMSRCADSARYAADYTSSAWFPSLKDLVGASDVILLTVPDGAISSVWEELKTLPLQNKIIGHCSGCISSAVFSGIESTGAYGCSVHPLCAVHSGVGQEGELSQAFFTLEGSFCCTAYFSKLLGRLGNPVRIIQPEDKVRYHGAAVLASNLPIALWQTAAELMERCGFSEEEARQALTPLILGNAQAFCRLGGRDALTGPVERNDAGTAAKHMAVLSPKEKQMYAVLSEKLMDIAAAKHPNRDMSLMKATLSGGIRPASVQTAASFGSGTMKERRKNDE